MNWGPVKNPAIVLPEFSPYAPAAPKAVEGAEQLPGEASSERESKFGQQRCNQCGALAKEGAVDAGDKRWYCKTCWGSPPEGLKVDVSSELLKADIPAAPAEAPPPPPPPPPPLLAPLPPLPPLPPLAPTSPLANIGGAVAAPVDEAPALSQETSGPLPGSEHDTISQKQWDQLFKNMRSIGMEERVQQCMASVNKLKTVIAETTIKYRSAISQEQELFKTAVKESLEIAKAQKQVEEQQGPRPPLPSLPPVPAPIQVPPPPLPPQVDQVTAGLAQQQQEALQAAFQGAAAEAAQAMSPPGVPQLLPPIIIPPVGDPAANLQASMAANLLTSLPGATEPGIDTQAYLNAIQMQQAALAELQSSADRVQAEVKGAQQAAVHAVIAQERMAGRGGDLPQRPGVQACAFYMKTGDCKYGSTCRWDHPLSRASAELSESGYPKRPGEADCSYYMKTGKCAYGQTCRWNHPDRNAATIPSTM